MAIALSLFLLATILGMSLLVAGVYILAGFGWSLLACGACLLSAAAFIRSGMRAHENKEVSGG
ncbi:hypothetical protein [Orrella sp. 11846]|uniref:hypothetical protein n=1 Tax=Orrella sp. 11846 TaxID=3409913 RepID=UPI003B5CB716